jgi:hypothetical protein
MPLCYKIEKAISQDHFICMTSQIQGFHAWIISKYYKTATTERLQFTRQLIENHKNKICLS